MTAQIINGKEIAASIRLEVKQQVFDYVKKHGKPPRLDVLLVGDNPASQLYVRKKAEACQEVGIQSKIWEYDYNISQDDFDLEMRLHGYHGDCNGLLVQLPLPSQLNTKRVFDLINPLKDVDVFHPHNVGLLIQGRPRFLPCTPHGIQKMLARTGIYVAGKHVVVINRSDIVGKPLSSMLIQDCDEYANATVTVCHDRTPPDELKKITQSANIVVVAVGIPGFLKGDMVNSESIVVDVGTTKVGNRVVGDADASVLNVAKWITPVPGGVGPMTVAMLLENTLKAARIQNER
jgi:methylenetetrahydrofolate dehydrogenase (NADP+)/methenyltetrahydrofolate cyclohydrolase